MKYNEIIENQNKSEEIYTEVKIGGTVYRVTSRFSGNKRLDEALKALALRQAEKFAR